MSFFNPREASPEVLEATLVGREEILADLAADLARQATSESRQHWLIRGPRGIGKTHLMGIVYHRVLADPALAAAYLPVWLSETEAYEVYSSATFLLNVARQLAEELREGDPGAAAALERGIEATSRQGDDPALFEELSQILTATARERGRILLVLMENLDALLAGFRGTRGSQDTKRLRSLLAHAHELLFLSTTPTRYLAELSNPKEPLYGQLKERTLAPLTEEQVGRLFEKLAEATGSTVAAGGVDRVRRRVLHRLTGGNPRSLVMAFSVMAGTPGVRAMVEELSALLDAQTAYFEARLARLAPREGTIVTAMALAPQNLTIQEIAKLTRLPERSLSTQIKRLEEEGYVAPAFGEGAKGTIYELTDGLFRVWYQYRKGRKLLEPLVRFLAIWYTPEELESEAAVLDGELARADRPLLEIEMDRMTRHQFGEALRFATSPEGKAEREALWAECAVGDEIDAEFGALPPDLQALLRRAEKATAEELESGIERIWEALDQRKLKSLPSVVVAEAVLRLARRLWELEEHEKAGCAIRGIIDRFEPDENTALQGVVARAQFNLGLTLGQLGKYEEALAVYRSLIDRFHDSERPEFQEAVAVAQVNFGGTLGQLGRAEEALAAFRSLTNRFQSSELPEIQEQVAVAQFNIGVSLGHLGQAEEALAAYRSLVDRCFQSSERPEIEEAVAKAQFNIGVSLGQLGRAREALAAFRSLTNRFHSSVRPEIQKLVAESQLGIGVSLGQLGRAEEALAVYRSLLDCFQNSERPEIQEAVVKAQFNLGLTLSRLGRREEALAAICSLLEHVRDPSQNLPSKMVQVMIPWTLNLASALRALDEVASWLGMLVDSSRPEVTSFATLYHYVLSVLKAEEQADRKKGIGGLATRRRRALARVPPELHQTVEEAVEEVWRLRRTLE